jgi:hypothetical protein
VALQDKKWRRPESKFCEGGLSGASLQTDVVKSEQYIHSNQGELGLTCGVHESTQPAT